MSDNLLPNLILMDIRLFIISFFPVNVINYVSLCTLVYVCDKLLEVKLLKQCKNILTLATF